MVDEDFEPSNDLDLNVSDRGDFKTLEICMNITEKGLSKIRDRFGALDDIELIYPTKFLTANCPHLD